MLIHLQNRLDKLTRLLLRKLNHKAAVTTVILVNVLMYLPVVYRLRELDQLADYHYTFQTVQGAKFFYHITSFIFSSFFSLLFVQISKLYAEKFLPTDKNIEPGMFFASLAVMSWALSSCLMILNGYYFLTEPYDKVEMISDLNRKWIAAMSGDLNTFFFMCVIPYLEFEQEPKLIQSCRRWFLNRKGLFLIGIIWIIFYVVIFFWAGDNGIGIVKKTSFVITLFSYRLFFIAFRRVFTERIKEQRAFFDITAILLLASILIEPFEGYFTLWDLAVKIILFGYRPLLLIVFVPLLLSSVYNMYKKKSEIVEKQIRALSIQEQELNKANQELIDKTNKYEQEAKINKGLLPIILKNLDDRSLDEVLAFCLETLKDDDIYDYAFGVGILEKDRNHILFPYYFEDDKKIINNRISTEKTFGGYCANNNEEVPIPSIYDRETILRYGVDPDKLGKKTAKEAQSLHYFPLRNPNDGTCFGVMTIQSREDKRYYTDEQKNVMAALVYILEQALDSKDIETSAIINFIRAVKSGEEDYHLEKLLKRKSILEDRKLDEKARLYRNLYDLLGTEEVASNTFLGLSLAESDFLQGVNFIQKDNIDIKDFYWEYHPVNLTLKGVFEGRLPCSLLLLVLTALEQHKHKQTTNDLPMIKNSWHLLVKLWLFEGKNSSKIPELSEHNVGAIDDFCRGGQRQDKLEEIITVVSDLFEILFLWDKEGKEHGKQNLKRVAFHLPDLNETIEGWPLNKSGILFEFGIRGREELEAKIGDAHAFYKKNGAKGLSNNVSSKIVLLQSFYFPGGPFQYKVTNHSIILKFFL